MLVDFYFNMYLTYGGMLLYFIHGSGDLIYIIVHCFYVDENMTALIHVVLLKCFNPDVDFRKFHCLFRTRFFFELGWKRTY